MIKEPSGSDLGSVSESNTPVLPPHSKNLEGNRVLSTDLADDLLAYLDNELPKASRYDPSF